ncbi:beta-galactosidase [Desemzia sp. FAM 24101]|uniref:beta-galactosidase n=1 Tax=unclassified Desemzia TaxID=2685243 RepID=UPI003887EFA6
MRIKDRMPNFSTASISTVIQLIIDDTRVFREVAELGNELAHLGNQLIGAETKARIGIIFDWDNYWALEYTSGPTVDLYYVDQIQRYYETLYHNQVAVDIIPVDADFEQYDMILAPVLYMVKKGTAEKLEQFVAKGGTFLTSFMSGIVDQSDNVHLGGYPGPLRKLLGIWVEEIDALAPEKRNTVEFGSRDWNKPSYECSMLCDLLHLEGAEAIAEYKSDFYKGMPAVTKNSFGKGEAWYLATLPEKEMLQEIIDHLLKEKNIVGFGVQPEGIEITSRVKDGKEFIFVMNHTDEAQTVANNFVGYEDILSSAEGTEELLLEPFGVRIYTK